MWIDSYDFIELIFFYIYFELIYSALNLHFENRLAIKKKFFK